MYSEQELGQQHHARMVTQIEEQFPTLTAKQRRYVQNKVSNILRQLGQDIYGVWVTNKYIEPAQYCSYDSFIVGETVKVYVAIQVD